MGTFAPFFFNPNQFESISSMVNDLRFWIAWLRSSAGTEEQSWLEWATRQSMDRRSASRLMGTLTWGSFCGVACTTALVYRMFPLFKHETEDRGADVVHGLFA